MGIHIPEGASGASDREGGSGVFLDGSQIHIPREAPSPHRQQAIKREGSSERSEEDPLITLDIP